MLEIPVSPPNNQFKKMSSESITFILSLAGALAWVPQVIQLIKKQKLFGKLISRYHNYNDKQSFFLFKLSLLSKNQSFNIKKIDCTIEYENSKVFSCDARNMRKVIFNRNDELKVLGKDYINNLSILPKDENILGYLFFSFDHVEEAKIRKTIFDFTPFIGKKKRLIFNENEIDERALFYDDSIWQKSN